MSHILQIKCSACGEDFSREYGIGVMGYGTLYCRVCGKPRVVDLSGGWEPIAPCGCGGTLDETALGACSKCGKLLEKKDVVE